MKTFRSMVAVAGLLVGAFAASGADMLQGECFAQALGWSSYIAPDVNKAGGSVTFEGKRVAVISPAVAKQSASSIQLMKQLPLDVGKSYKFKFKVNTDKNGSISVIYFGHTKSVPYAFASVNVEPGEKEYTCMLTVKTADDGTFENERSLRLLLGGFNGTKVILSDAAFEEI